MICRDTVRRRWLWLLLLAATLPLSSCAQADKQTVMVPMTDGAHLATDVWLPNGAGPFPVVLARTPYNKNMMGMVGGGYNVQHLAFVVQDTRGRFASEGQARPFLADGPVPPADGLATVKWILQQPWCNGKIATVGASALGIAQYLLAETAPPGVVASYVVVGSGNLFNGGFFEGGVFRQALVEGWYQGAGWPAYAIEDPQAHPTYDATWKSYDLASRAKLVRYPMMHVGGWHDIFSQSTIDAFAALQDSGGEGARGRQHLVMGPWTHSVSVPKIGQLTMPDNSKWPPGAPDEGRWSAAFLLGKAAEMDALPAVWYYVMGDPDDPQAPGKCWRTADRWPPAGTVTPFYLGPEGQLLASAPPAGNLQYTYDPKNPVPTVGGRNLTLPAGSFDQRPVENRPDVLLFTTPVLDKPLEVTGRITVRLFAASSAPDTDFTAKVSDVYPDGRSMLVTDSILRARFREGFDREVLLKPGTAYEFTIDLGSTSLVLSHGHRLRLAISSSNAPRFEPNPNTGARWRANKDMQPAQQTVFFGGKRASCVLLPVPT